MINEANDTYPRDTDENEDTTISDSALPSQIDKEETFFSESDGALAHDTPEDATAEEGGENEGEAEQKAQESDIIETPQYFVDEAAYTEHEINGTPDTNGDSDNYSEPRQFSIITEDNGDAQFFVEDSEDEKITNYTEKQKEPQKEKSRLIDTVFDFLELFIFTLVAVLVFTTFFFRHSVVEGDSMMNTLQDGETLIISNLFYKPSQFDVIVFEDYGTGLDRALVKRVIATEGQRVRVCREGIYVDGEFLQEDYVYTDTINYTYSTVPSREIKLLPDFYYRPGQYYEFTVPEGELFVLGDHRDASQDSIDFGTINESSVLGKVIVRIYPFAKFGAID